MVAALLEAHPEAAQVADKVRGGAAWETVGLWMCVCEREEASACMRGLVYSDMHTHRVYGMWVCARACLRIQEKCVWKSVFAYLCEYACICTHTYLLTFV